MSRLIISVGIPGSGKTTALRAVAAKNHATIICPDDIRFKVTGSKEDQSRNEEVWHSAFRQLHIALQTRHDVIVDATNTQGEDRRFLVKSCRNYANPSRRFELWYFTTPLEECLRRNAARECPVPEHVITRMAQQLKDDPIDMAREGYDVLVFV